MSTTLNQHRFSVDQYERMIENGILKSADTAELMYCDLLQSIPIGGSPLPLVEALRQHRFTVDQYDRLIDLGILDEDDKVELIHGEIVEKMSPIGPNHSACLRHLRYVLGSYLGKLAIIGVQDPVRLRDSEPEPDLILLAPVNHKYFREKPRATDVLLIVEVADSSLLNDRKFKKSLYAENGIIEYWIYNIFDKQVEIFRGPQPDGNYADVQILTASDRIRLLALPDVEIKLGEILDILP